MYFYNIYYVICLYVNNNLSLIKSEDKLMEMLYKKKLFLYIYIYIYELIMIDNI